VALSELFFGIELRRKGSGSAQPQLPAEVSRTFCLALPGTSEQQKIVEAVNQYTLRITHEHGLLTKLSAEKSDLVDDLLSGGVRVTPLLNTDANAVS